MRGTDLADPRTSDRDLVLIASLAVLAILIFGLPASIPGATFVLQLAGIGTLAGTAYALVRRLRNASHDMALPIAAFTCLFAAVGLLIQLASLLA
jgi:uncharacterized membrane protein YhaH (DUF805 family)